MSDGGRWPCVSARAGGALLAVVVTPNAPRTAADGLHDGALRVRLAAPPVDGKANEALEKWLAQALAQPRRAVRLVRGASSRRKQLEIDVSPDDVRAWLDCIFS